MGIKKLLCDLIDEDKRGYVKVWEVMLYSILFFVCVGTVVLVFTITGHAIYGVYLNSFEWLLEDCNRGIVNTITIINIVIGFIFWCLFIIIGDLIYNILTLKIISCPVNNEDLKDEGPDHITDE